MIEISSYLYEKGLVPGKSGNISIRYKKDEFERIAVTPSGLSLKSLAEKDIVIVDMEENKIYNDSKTPTSELLMHLKIYKTRKDVNAVIHTHSPIATGFAFAGEKIEKIEGFGPVYDKFIINRAKAFYSFYFFSCKSKSCCNWGMSVYNCINIFSCFVYFKMH